MVVWDNMTLMDIAVKGRSQRDSLLKLATGVLVLEDQIRERQDAIREQAVIEMDSEGVPTVSSFRDSDLVERLQEEIVISSGNKEVLQEIINEIETAFASFELQAMSMGNFDEKITEAQSRSETLARKINQLVVRLLHSNPALTLPQLFANEELLAMESERGVAVSAGLAEAQRLIKLKDQLLPLCADGSIIAESVFHPMRAAVSDPAKISQLRSA